MRLLCILILMLGSNAIAHSQSVPVKNFYQKFRYDEDYGYLRDSRLRDSELDSIKYVQVGNNKHYMIFGGELRERYHNIQQVNFGLDEFKNDDYLLQRVLLHTDLHLGDFFRTFVQFGSHHVFGKENEIRPVEKDTLDLQQAFFDISIPTGPNKFMLRVGRQAVGRILWGYVAEIGGLPFAFILAAAGMLLGIPVTWKYRISGYEKVDFTPTMHWPSPLFADEPQPDQGPVMVTLEYVIASDKQLEFMNMSLELQKMRRRSGAYFWELFQDPTKPDHFMECFMVESWLEHLRQHERVSKADQIIEDKINLCLTEKNSKHVSHYVAVNKLMPTPTKPGSII